jgi:hypothetical protein
VTKIFRKGLVRTSFTYFHPNPIFAPLFRNFTDHPFNCYQLTAFKRVVFERSVTRTDHALRKKKRQVAATCRPRCQPVFRLRQCWDKAVKRRSVPRNFSAIISVCRVGDYTGLQNKCVIINVEKRLYIQPLIVLHSLLFLHKITNLKSNSEH